MCVTERGAPRSESIIYMIAGGNHTTTNFTRITTSTVLGTHWLRALPAYFSLTLEAHRLNARAYWA